MAAVRGVLSLGQDEREVRVTTGAFLWVDVIHRLVFWNARLEEALRAQSLLSFIRQPELLRACGSRKTNNRVIVTTGA